MSGVERGRKKKFTVQQVGLIAALFLLVPGMRYFMPTGDLFMCKLMLVLGFAWLVHTIAAALGLTGQWHARLRIGLAVITAIFLVHPNLFFGLLLFAFFRHLLIAVYLVVLILILVTALRLRTYFVFLLIALCLAPLSGMLAFWWNFTMFGGGGFDPKTAPPGVSAVFSLAEWRDKLDVGKAHPYALAYDEQNEVLLASFKDDWRAVFHLGGKHNHNFIVMRPLNDSQADPKVLFFGTSLQPENIALYPPEKIGWVNLLDVKGQTFHVASFSYADNELKLKSMNPLPAEPNAIFIDAAQRRLLIVGIQMELMDLDPATLKVRSVRNLLPDLHPAGLKNDIFNRLLKSELSLMMSLYDRQNDRMFLAMVGHYVHALSLKNFKDVRTPSYPLSVGLDFDEARHELAVSRPVQGRITIINTKTMEVKEEFDVGAPLRPIALLRKRNWILTGAYTANETMIVDRNTGRVAHRFQLGRLQRHAISTPAGDRAFLATGWGVFAIDIDQLP